MGLPVDGEPGFAVHRAVPLHRLEMLQGDGRGAVEVFAAENIVDGLRREFGALGVGSGSDSTGDDRDASWRRVRI